MIKDDPDTSLRDGLLRLFGYYQSGRNVSTARLYYEAYANIPELRYEFEFDRSVSTHDYLAMARLSKIIEICDTATFYDLVEAFHRTYDLNRAELRREFEEDFNRLAIRTGSPFRFTEGSLKRTFPPVVHEALKRGMLALQNDPRWVDAETLYERALLEISGSHRELDNAVGDAVKAVESCLQVIVGSSDLTLPDLVQRLRQGKVHDDLLDILRRLFSYRSDIKGAAHGRAGREEARVWEAEFAVANCGLACAMLIEYQKSLGSLA